ncbi:MAG: hypothetical protein HOD47_05515, partial [Gammaproteobacteria bacterium]|nr:hypothetical protein [Gammaproteobacteria bacterium]
MKPTAIKIALSTLMATSLMLSPVTHASEILNDFSLKKDGSTVQYSNTHRRSLAGELNKVSRLLTDQLAQNRDMKRISNTPIAVTSIVDLENFKSTNKIGLWLTENMMHELQVRGFNVVDFKMMPAIQVTENGDFSMSKLVKELRGKHNINYVMTGTFAEHPAGVLINARIVNMENSTVVSSG